MTENKQREVTIIDSYPALAQDGVIVSPYGISPCHTAGHGNCTKILIEYDGE